MVRRPGDYERRGRWNDAEPMWTCRECGGKPGKAVAVLETIEHVQHHPDCAVLRKQQREPDAGVEP